MPSPKKIAPPTREASPLRACQARIPSPAYRIPSLLVVVASA